MANLEYNCKEVQVIINMIRDASKKELIIISLFLLPFLLGVWCIALNNISFLDRYPGWKFLIILVLLILYIGGIIHMKCTDTQEDKLERARVHVENRLRKRVKNWASFDAIRSLVNESYSNEFLEKLIDVNPGIFGKCFIKAEGREKKGIKLVESELINESVNEK